MQQDKIRCDPSLRRCVDYVKMGVMLFVEVRVMYVHTYLLIRLALGLNSLRFRMTNKPSWDVSRYSWCSVRSSRFQFSLPASICFPASARMH